MAVKIRGGKRVKNSLRAFKIKAKEKVFKWGKKANTKTYTNTNIDWEASKIEGKENVLKERKR